MCILVDILPAVFTLFAFSVVFCLSVFGFVAFFVFRPVCFLLVFVVCVVIFAVLFLFGVSSMRFPGVSAWSSCSIMLFGRFRFFFCFVLLHLCFFSVFFIVVLDLFVSI